MTPAAYIAATNRWRSTISKPATVSAISCSFSSIPTFSHGRRRIGDSRAISSSLSDHSDCHLAGPSPAFSSFAPASGYRTAA